MSVRRQAYKILQLFRHIMRREVIEQVHFGKKGQVALTFDDGYGDIDRLLDKLNQHNVKATFFFVGEWMKENTALCRKMAEEGHEIGNHTYSHCKMRDLSVEERENEIRLTQEVLTDITGKDSHFFRFPYRSLNKELIQYIYGKGMLPIGWTIDTRDWEGLEAEQICERVLGGQKTEVGSIVLMHTTGKHTAEALDLMIPALKAGGYQLVKVSELLQSATIYRKIYRAVVH